jgi:hypothetical protein
MTEDLFRFTRTDCVERLILVYVPLHMAKGKVLTHEGYRKYRTKEQHTQSSSLFVTITSQYRRF